MAGHAREAGRHGRESDDPRSGRDWDGMTVLVFRTEVLAAGDTARGHRSPFGTGASTPRRAGRPDTWGHCHGFLSNSLSHQLEGDPEGEIDSAPRSSDAFCEIAALSLDSP